ncbi:MAG: hypothetical protein ACFFB3_07730, partial [Candidatus Hodarchaeota archaeon]
FIFFLFNILIPYFKLLFPYMEWDKASRHYEFWASGVFMTYDPSDSAVTNPPPAYSRDIIYNDFEDSFSDQPDTFWKFLDVWQYFFLLGGLLALVLIIIPSFIDLRGTKPPNINLRFFGLISGLIASGVEWFLFVVIYFFYDWRPYSSPDFGFPLIITNIIGFIALYLAYKPSIIIEN